MTTPPQPGPPTPAWVQTPFQDPTAPPLPQPQQPQAAPGPIAWGAAPGATGSTSTSGSGSTSGLGSGSGLGQGEEKPWAAWTAQAMLAKKPRGWWRRNVWGLVLVLPLLATVVGVRWSDIYEDVWKTQPLNPVSATQQQWIDFNGAQMRLVEFGQATNLVDRSNKPINLPGGIKAWRAVVEFKAPNQDAVTGCKVTLEDARGREFSMHPAELALARTAEKSISCSRPTEGGSTDYRATFFFVSPGDAQPVAVRIMWRTRYPDFARLRVA